MVLYNLFWHGEKKKHYCRVLFYRTFVHFFSQKDQWKNIPGCYLSSSMCIDFKQVLCQWLSIDSTNVSATCLLGELFYLAHQNMALWAHQCLYIREPTPVTTVRFLCSIQAFLGLLITRLHRKVVALHHQTISVTVTLSPRSYLFFH